MNLFCYCIVYIQLTKKARALQTSPPKGRAGGTALTGPPHTAKAIQQAHEERKGGGPLEEDGYFILRHPLSSTRGTTRDGESPAVTLSSTSPPRCELEKGPSLSPLLRHYHLITPQSSPNHSIPTDNIQFHTIHLRPLFTGPSSPSKEGLHPDSTPRARDHPNRSQSISTIQPIHQSHRHQLITENQDHHHNHPSPEAE